MRSTGADGALPVVIAGGGASGVTLGLMLAARGVRSVVIEREVDPQTLPRAHAVNPRTLEILRELGVSAAELRRVAAPQGLTSEVRFVTTLTGHCFGALPYERQDDEVLAVTPTPLLNVPQPALEAVLFDRAAHEPSIDFRRGHSWVAAAQGDDMAMTSTVQTTEDEYRIVSRYLVAADGAGSSVRDSLGIAMAGVDDVASAVSITFRADLTDLVRRRPGILHWVFGAAQPGVLLSYYPDRLWGFNMSMPAGRVDMSRYDGDRAGDLVRLALGPGAADLSIDIIAVTPWTMRCQVADRFRAGNVFLAGDAAHRFPPTGGLGLNTSLQDVHNLAWKLAAVLGGWAGDALLNTYDRERRPVANRNAEQSLANMRAMGALQIFDEPARFADDSQRFHAWLNQPGRSGEIDHAIGLQRDHFDSLALQLGFSYDPDDDPVTDVAHFVPRARPGVRLPHGWLDHGGREVSTLDLVDPTAFTVLRLRGGSQLNEPALGLAPVPVTVVALDPAESSVNKWMRAVGLRSDTDIVVRPDGHIVTIVDGDEVVASDRVAGCIRSFLGDVVRDDQPPGHERSYAEGARS